MSRKAVIEAIVEAILAVQRPHPTRVAFDGIDAAGKTTLANEVALGLADSDRPVIRASLDGFHNPRSMRYRQGENSPAGYYEDSFNCTSLIKELLQPLGPGGSRRFRTEIFDFQLDQEVKLPQETATPEAILLFDGVFLHRPVIRPFWDLTLFIRISFDNSPRACPAARSCLHGICREGDGALPAALFPRPAPLPGRVSAGNDRRSGD